MAHGLTIAPAHARLTRTAALVDGAERLRFARGARGAALERLGLLRVRDALLHVPRRYLDFTARTSIALADVGADVTVVGRVDRLRLKRPRPRMQIVEMHVTDDTGVIMATFFKQPWIAEQVHEGDIVALSGKVTFGYGFKQMKAPFYEVVGSAADAGGYSRILPVHPVGEGITASWMRRIISAALGDMGDFSDFLPAELSAKRGLPSLARAVRDVHFPVRMADAHAARRRLAYDELLCLQIALLARRRIELADATPYRHTVSGPAREALICALGFELTDEQKAAVEDILADMAAPFAMNRLLLGDVGTGKTAVAAVALAACADSGSQAAVMAPTSVLARQYAEKLGPVLDAAGISWTLITGSTPAAEREQAVAAIAAGETCVTFGTTAILSDDVAFRQLSLVVIDEQHRFGVNQRVALRGKGKGADVLTMTATPIPRTLALSLYGDVDCSRIRTRPRAGAGITTRSIPPENEHLALTAIADAIAKGRQAYVICPLVDDSDTGEELDDVPEQTRSQAASLHSASSVYERFARDVFPDVEVGLLHGRMTATEKDEVMGAFDEGRISVLVSTTVVEVGVDVPNATVMLVYDADRFGLATLHQLRGRVGRGDIAGEVFLECAAKPESAARQRLSALEATSDGFELAELDLRLRHEGEVLGYRQSGGISLKIADLAEDGDLIEAAHEDARAIVSADESLSDPVHAPLALEIRDRFGAWFDELERA